MTIAWPLTTERRAVVARRVRSIVLRFEGLAGGEERVKAEDGGEEEGRTSGAGERDRRAREGRAGARGERGCGVLLAHALAAQEGKTYDERDGEVGTELGGGTEREEAGAEEARLEGRGQCTDATAPPRRIRSRAARPG